MSVLVLGGAGYIGSHTVRALIDAGRDVVVADNLLTGFKAAVHPKAKFYELDIRDRVALDDLFEKEDIEGVIHFAASSQVGESMQDPLKYYDNNLHGTMVLLSSMVAHGVDKIVFSSTAATYGEPERVPILETDKTEPTNCYGETKLSMEKMMKWTSVAHGLHYVALRYFNACGAQPDGSIGVIDFNRWEVGDPWEEFYKLQSFGKEVSVPYCVGQINAYFNGDPPEDFWRVLAVYVAWSSLFSIKWAEQFGSEEIAGMVRRCKAAFADFDDFRRVVPCWYK